MSLSSAPRSRPILNLPPVTKALLAVNIGVHALRWVLPARIDAAALVFFAFAPIRYVTVDWHSWSALLSPVTYQFLHGGWAHLGINMLGLLAFGSGVEQRLGPRRFLLFYIGCGILAAAAQFLAGPESARLLVGASGAISGLFGAVLRFQPATTRGGFWTLVLVWLAMNVLTGQEGMVGDRTAPIAWVAHIGGFVAGLLLFPSLDRQPRPAGPRESDDRVPP